MRKMLISFVCVGMSTAIGCDRDADCLARVARCAASKGEAVAADASSLQAIRSNMDEFSLEAKVTARLRWEKSLEGAQITVQTDKGIVELKGVVARMEQRKRAIEIAQETAGVEKVIDSLTVNTPAS